MISNVALLLCLLIVAVMTAGATAIRSASRIWLRHWAERRLRGAQSVLLYLDDPQRLLTAAHVATAAALTVAGAIIGWQTAGDREDVVLALVGYAALVLLAGQLVPRVLARRWPLILVPLVTPPLRVVQVITAPFLPADVAPARGQVSATDDAETLHEIVQDLLREGELEGIGRSDEIAIISGVMEFGAKTVSEVMTRREDIVAIPIESDWHAAANLIAESAFTRVPVFKGSLDHVVGMYHAFDVLKERAERLPPLHQVAYAYAGSPCNDLLFRMLRARLHLAVVQDSGGKTVGIATLENLLEELVGDIRDEHDDPGAAGAPRAKP